jgi:PAS domain S-box-containing protein
MRPVAGGVAAPVANAAGVGTLSPEVCRLACEACPSGMFIVDHAGLIRQVNGETERLFGYSRDELLGRPIELLLPESLREKHVRHRAGYAMQPAARHFGTGRDFNGRRKDGSTFSVEVGLNPLQVGAEQMVIGGVVDISERKRLAQMQDEFVSTVSHELRTPLTSIAASLGLLRAADLPQPAAHLIEIAEANCRRLVRMVNDLLDLKKLDAGQMPFHFERCEARALLDKAIEANRGLAAGCGVAIRLDAAAPAPAVLLYVDPDRFIQVITNLLSNAIKFSPAGTEVTVGLAKRGDNVRISVRDHGAGIPPEFRPRLFETFAQAENGSKKGGSGLGLSIVRRIVAGLHGQIGFSDVVGGGTVFHVDLPNAEHLVRWQGSSSPAV